MTGNGRFEVAVVLRDLSGIFSFCGLFLESLRLVEEIAGGHSVPGQCPVGRQRLGGPVVEAGNDGFEAQRMVWSRI